MEKVVQQLREILEKTGSDSIGEVKTEVENVTVAVFPAKKSQSKNLAIEMQVSEMLVFMAYTDLYSEELAKKLKKLSKIVKFEDLDHHDKIYKRR